ncbi:MAG: uridine monophosphate kinase [Lachnospirales bacterium]
MFKRVLIKLSGEVLAGEKGFGFDESTINPIVDDIVTANKNSQINLVVGGGNFWRGRSKQSGFDRSRADHIGMLGTAMNGLFLADTFRQKGVKARVFSPVALASFTEEFTKDKALENLENNGINIFVCGLGHPYFSTDTIASLRAAELECDCLMFAKSVDGIYDKDPATNSDAKKYSELTYRKIIEDDLKAIDTSAMSICEEAGIVSLVFALDAKNSIIHGCNNDDMIYEIGTLVK